jgi:phage repressor protein C with HTH and peptisase S24 domain
MILKRGPMPDEGAELLEELMRFRPDGVTPNAWAVRAGVSRTIWSDLKRHGNPSRRTLSKLLDAAGSSLAEFEALRIGRPTEAARLEGQVAEAGRRWGDAPLALLPVVSTKAAGYWGDPDCGIEMMAVNPGEVVDRLPRPPSLAADGNAYVVTITGASMWPRFRLGRRVAVSPASPVGVGDDVLVLLLGSRSAVVAELTRRTAEQLNVRQFHPAIEYEVPLGKVRAVHKVIGELI